jgi:hypothetical protein
MDNESKILTELAVLKTKLQSIQFNLDKLTVIMTGNGHPESGYISRVIKLEDDGKRRERLIRWCLGGVATIFTGVAVFAICKFI